MLSTPVRLAAAAVLLGVLIQRDGLAQQPAGSGEHLYNVSAGQPIEPVAPITTVYPRLNAPLYPAPVQYTPPWNGGTIITNQAFAPHEMLYPHTYRAVYPPFYYKVVGGWVVTPMGVKQNETWKLQGTEVKVRYRSYLNPLTWALFPHHN